MNWLTWTVIAGGIAQVIIFTRLALVSPAKARECLEAETIIIDVCNGEFKKGRLPRALMLPLDRQGDEVVRRAPDKGRVLLIHCLSGERSDVGRSLLKQGEISTLSIWTRTLGRRGSLGASDGAHKKLA